MSNRTVPAVVKADVASLDELESRIRTAHAGVVSAFSSAIGKSLEAGQALIAAKKLIAHGQWIPFLRRCDINDRTARRYMQFTELVDEKRSSTTDFASLLVELADLTLEQAIKRLSPQTASSASITGPAPPGEPPSVKTTHADIVAAWTNAPASERKRAIDSIGLEALLAAMPSAWLPLIANRLARPIVPAPLPADLPSDLTTAFLQRAHINGSQS
jgi:hypothetical protein